MDPFPLGPFSVARIGFGAPSNSASTTSIPPSSTAPGIADPKGRSPVQIALAWAMSVASNVLLIPGTSSVEHLAENLAVADIELDDETRAELSTVAA